MTDVDRLGENFILAGLPRGERERIGGRLEIVDMEVRSTIYDAGSPITEVVFPFDSVFSMVAVADDRIVVEVATIGREGMVGLPAFLGAPTSPHPTFCQVAGTAARMSVDALRASLNGDGRLHLALNRLAQATMVQIAQNVVCNSTHTLDQRAARWLLTTHDRVDRDTFSLTQEFLAQMLGVRRPTVSETARRLQAQQLIRYSRGQLTITDRPGLEALSCDCYRVVRSEFEAMAS